MPDDDDIRGLPPMLADFARKTSVGLALRLAADYGGETLYIPQSAPEGHWTVRCVGRAAADALSSLYGGEWIDIPRAAHRQAKKASISTATGTVNEIARRHGVTARYVRMVRSAAKGDPAQLSLLDRD